MRLIEVYVGKEDRSKLESALSALPIIHLSHVASQDETTAVRILVRAEDSGPVLDALEQRFSSDPAFRAILTKVEATLPRLERDEEENKHPDATPVETPKLRFGVSREELYTRVLRGSEVSTTYTVTVGLSTLVAAVGLWRNDLAVIIGAMAIAPLLGPNVALALATTLADQDLTRKALRANLIGVTLARAISLAVGSAFTVDPALDAIRSRTQVGPADIVVALAAGCAAALAYTTSLPAALIGVMVSVALLPPLVVFGLLFASGNLTLAMGAAMLLIANVICVNLSGVVMFLWQGVQPLTWWEAARAKDRTRKALAVWSVLLLLLITLMAVAFRE